MMSSDVLQHNAVEKDTVLETEEKDTVFFFILHWMAQTGIERQRYILSRASPVLHKDKLETELTLIIQKISMQHYNHCTISH